MNVNICLHGINIGAGCDLLLPALYLYALIELTSERKINKS
ncbi:hypothetical protein HMPREF0424_0421 [Gardnerella vaginalis 409-05]|nr:hypothetical protein HMPREF0424_0421 [Gardnerella vaginalis 409-05]